MICPSCNSDLNTAKTICPVCQYDLLTLMKMSEMPDIYFNNALQFYEKKDLLAAIEALAVVQVFNPSDIEAINLLGIIYIELGMLEKAKSNFLKALKIDSRNNYAKQALLWLQANGCEIPIDELFF